MTPSLPDPVIDEIHEIRRQIAAHCDHNPAKLVAYFKEIQKEFENQVIKAVKPNEQSDAPAA